MELHHWRSGQKELIVGPVSFEIAEGESVGLLGNSGSGKSLLSLALTGLLPRGVEASGTVVWYDDEISLQDVKQLARFRGNAVAYIYQDVRASFNPIRRCGKQCVKAIMSSTKVTKAEAKGRLRSLATRMGLEDTDRMFRSFPHQLSGGQLQRLMIARAIACDVRLLIADESTTALDTVAQREILQLLSDVKSDMNVSLLVISHDPLVTEELCDRVYRLPSPDAMKISRRSLSDEKISSRSAAMSQNPALLEIKGVVHRYASERGQVLALNDIDMHLSPGEVVGVVGQSGSGKSTLAQLIVGLLALQSGSINWHDEPMKWPCRDISWIPQAVSESFHPDLSVEQIITEALRYRNASGLVDKKDAVNIAMRSAGLDLSWRDKAASELSGGERQRLAIARAVVTEPDLVICDESFSGLQIELQDDILAMLRRRVKYGKKPQSLFLISHDLGMAARYCDRILVMHDAKIVDELKSPFPLDDETHQATRILWQAKLG